MDEIKIYDMNDILGLPLRLAYVVRQRRRGVLLKELALEFEVTPSSIRMWEMKAIKLILRGRYPDPDGDLIASEENPLIESLTRNIELVSRSSDLDPLDKIDAKIISLCADLDLSTTKLRKYVWNFARGGYFENAVRFSVCWLRASGQPRLPFPKVALLNERIDDLQRTARDKMDRCRYDIETKIAEYLTFARAATDDRWATHSRNDKQPSTDLHPILWRGRQWAVTTFGVEKLDGGYYLSHARLRDDPYLLVHVAAKPWCDVADFADAYIRATVLSLPSAVKVGQPSE